MYNMGYFTKYFIIASINSLVYVEYESERCSLISQLTLEIFTVLLYNEPMDQAPDPAEYFYASFLFIFALAFVTNFALNCTVTTCNEKSHHILYNFCY